MKFRNAVVHANWAKFTRQLLTLALLFGAVVSIAHAQEAAISGTVADPNGGAITGAAITIKNTETGAVRNLVSDDGGRYEAASLEVGKYDVTAQKTGFSASTLEVTLVVGQHATLDIKLPLASVQQAVQVQELAIVTEVTTTDVSGLVGEREVKDLPLNGRSYDQLLTLNAGVVNYTSQRAGGVGTSNSVVGNMFSASGRRPQENLYLLNGVEFTSASEINSTPGGTSGQLLGVDAVREFSMVKDTYGAEYGKRPGAQVNIVTASGTNQLHGSVYEFIRNSALDARNFFDFGSIPPFERNEFGGSLGGPIKKDKSFLFANYEGFRQKLGLSDVTLVPDASARSKAVASVQPLLALWPVANGPELLTSTGAQSGIAEAFSNPVQHIREDFGTARFDQNFSNMDSFSAVYTADDGTAHSPTTNPFSFVDLFSREQVVSLSETHVVSTSLINKATVGYSRGSFYFNSGTTVTVPGWLPGEPIGAVVVGGGTTLNGASQLTNGGTNAGSNLNAVRNLVTGTDQVTWTHGIHEFSFGGWVERIQANDSLIQDQYGQASFSALGFVPGAAPVANSFLGGTVSTYTWAPSVTPLGWRSLEGSFYAEDVIKLKPSLELRIGFRGESTNGWNEAHGRASNYLFNANGVINTQPTIGNSALTVNNAKFLPAPRIGIAWSPFGSKKTVIRAGFGTYYALIDNLSYRLDQNPPYNTVYASKNVPFASVASGVAAVPTFAGTFVIPSGVQPDIQTPTVQSYSFKIERQISATTSVSVGYTGSRGYHELMSLDVNLPSAPYPYPTQVTTATSTGLANPNVWNSTHWFSGGISTYNGMEVDVNHRLSHGLQFRGVYTYSKALDDGDSLNTSVATNSPAFTENPREPLWDYGRASFDIRHSGVINATYDLPFVRKGVNARLRQTLLGNWQVSGIETLQTGLPFTPQMSFNPSNDGDTRNPIRPSWNPAFTGPVILGGANEYFNPNAFLPPTAGTYGNVGRNVLQGAGLAETDLALAKRFSFSERYNLQFRAEFFNIFNRVNLNTPNPVVFTAATGGPSPTAGVITSTSTNSRQIQFGLKLLW